MGHTTIALGFFLVIFANYRNDLPDTDISSRFITFDYISASVYVPSRFYHHKHHGEGRKVIVRVDH